MIFREVHMIHGQFPTYARLPFLSFHVAGTLRKSKLTTPTYLSQLIGYVHVSTLSVYMFEVLFLSVFSYETK
jgi:hypothetical protein